MNLPTGIQTELKDYRIIISDLTLADLPKIKCARKAVVAKVPIYDGGHLSFDYHIVNNSVPSTYAKQQPAEYIKANVGQKLGDPTIRGATLLENKQMFVIKGSVGEKSVLPLKTFHVFGVEFKVYETIIYRYDRQDNLEFYAVQFKYSPTSDREILFFVKKEDFPDNKLYETFRAMLSIKDHRVQAFKHKLYRKVTAHKSNNYQGYINLKNVPETSNAIKIKFSEVAADINNAVVEYGDTAFSVMLGWLAYQNRNLQTEPYKYFNDRKWPEFYNYFVALLETLNL